MKEYFSFTNIYKGYLKSLLLCILFTLIHQIAICQVSITTPGASYAQDFNTLASAGTSTTMPVGWFFSETGSSANTTYTAGNGAGTSGETFSFGATGNTDRALGGLRSGSLNPTFGAAFSNNTGEIVTSIIITYTGEQWRLGATGRADNLNFQYSLDATSLTTGTWINVSSLNFTAPQTTGAAGALDGNLSANRTVVSATISSLAVIHGTTIWIKWTDTDASGADDGLGVDDFSITLNTGGAIPASSESDITAVASSESATISSLTTGGITNNTSGVQVWSFAIRDGGSDLTDTDALPTIVNSIVLTQNAGNAVNDWSDAIQEVALFDGTTKLANGLITANTITFSGEPLISIPDEESKLLTIRLTLQQEHNNSGSNIDGDDFVFNVTNANVTKAASGSSSFSSFTTASSTNGLNALDVVATQLSFTGQPFTTDVNALMAPPPIVSATDIYGNIDRGASGNVNITSTGTLSASSTLSASLVNGSASFSNLIHSITGVGYTLNASLTGLTGSTSTTFNITTPGGTQFAKGDLLILAFNSNRDNDLNGIKDDEITFFSLKDITNGTTFFLIDNGYERKYAGLWGTTEGFLKFQKVAGATIPAGKILNIGITIISGGSSASHFKIFDQCGNDLTGQFNLVLEGSGTRSFNANEKDDFWFGQGGSFTNIITSTTDPEVHKASYNGTIITGWTATGYQPCVGTGGTSSTPWNDINSACSNDATGTEGSTLPLRMSCFVVDLSSSSILTADRKKVKYTGPITITDKKGWIDRMNDVANWTGYADDATYDAGPNYVNSILCDPLPIDPTIGSPGSWQGSKSSDWFDCDNWATREVPDANTDVIIQAGTNNALVDDLSFFAPLYNSIAVAKSVTISNTMQLSLGATNSDVLNVGGNIILNNTSRLNNGYGVLTINGGNMTLNGASQFNNDNGVLTINGNLTFNNSSGMNGGTTGITNLLGNFAAASTTSITPQTGTFRLRGSTEQTITNGHANPIFNNLTIENTSDVGVTVAGTAPVQMSGALTLTDGLVNTSLTNILTLTATASSTSGSDISFVNGPMKKIGNTAFSFPVGKPVQNIIVSIYNPSGLTGGWRPLSISAPGTITDAFTAEFIHFNANLIGTITSPGLQAVSACEYWGLKRESSTEVDVSLTWKQKSICTPAAYVAIATPIVVAVSSTGTPTVHTSGNWTNHGGSGAFTNPPYEGTSTWSQVPAAYYKNPTLSNYAGFTPFTLGTTNWQQAPLPYTLSTFKASSKDKTVQLDWQVVHNDRVRSYTVERSKDGVRFAPLKLVAARVNEQNAAYIDNDPAPFKGWGYYRLRITDNEGNSTYSSIQKVWIGNAPVVQVSPNPVKDQLFINTGDMTVKEISLVNNVGQTLLRTTPISTSTILDLSKFNAGVYYVRILTNEGVVTEQVIKQ